MCLRFSNTGTYRKVYAARLKFKGPVALDAVANAASAAVLGGFSDLHNQEESVMDNNRFEGNWHQFKGKVREQWDKLTDDDLDAIDGRREHLLGKLQERHGMTQAEAETQFTDWHRKNPTNFFERY